MVEYDLNRCIKCGTMKHLNTCQRCYEELNSINMQQSMKDKAKLTTEIDKLEDSLLRKQSRNQFLEDRLDHYKKEIEKNKIALTNWENGEAVKQMQYAYGLYHNESVEISKELKITKELFDAASGKCEVNQRKADEFFIELNKKELIIKKLGEYLTKNRVHFDNSSIRMDLWTILRGETSD